MAHFTVHRESNNVRDVQSLRCRVENDEQSYLADSYASYSSSSDDDDLEKKFLEDSLRKASVRRQNKSFNELQLRDIERTNSILVGKLESNTRRRNRFAPEPLVRKFSNAEINRKKQQRQTGIDNALLIQKLKTVKPRVSSVPK